MVGGGGGIRVINGWAVRPWAILCVVLRYVGRGKFNHLVRKEEALQLGWKRIFVEIRLYVGNAGCLFFTLELF